MKDKKPLKKEKFVYTFKKRYAEIGVSETSNEYGKHSYLTCLDKLDLGMGKGDRIYLVKYAADFLDSAGQPKMIKAWELSVNDLKNIAAALKTLG